MGQLAGWSDVPRQLAWPGGQLAAVQQVGGSSVLLGQHLPSVNRSGSERMPGHLGEAGTLRGRLSVHGTRWEGGTQMQTGSVDCSTEQAVQYGH